MEEETLTWEPPLGGVKQDIPTTLLPGQYATRVMNVSITKKELSKRTGCVQLGTNLPLSGAVVGFRQYTTYAGNSQAVAFTTDNIYRLAPNKQWVSILDTNPWSSTIAYGVKSIVINDTLVFTNNSDPIRKWDGISSTVTTIGATFKAKDVEAYRERALYFNLIDQGAYVPQRVRWAALGTYDDFTDTKSGFMDLVDTSGYIQNATKLAGDLVIYKNDSIIVCSYLGGRPLFAFDTRVVNLGLVASRAVVDMDSYHLFLGNDNIYKYDGGRYCTPVGDAVQDLLVNSLQPQYINRSFAKKHGSQAWFFIPTASSIPDTLLIYDTKTDNWTYGAFSATNGHYYTEQDTVTIGDLHGNIGDLSGPIGSFGAVSVSTNMCVGDANGYVYYFSDAYGSDNGKAIPAMWESGDLVLYINGRLIWNRFRGVDVEAKGQAIDLEISTDEGESWIDLGSQNLGTGYDWHMFDFDLLTSKIRIRLSNSYANSTFKVRRIKFRYLKDVIRC